MSSTLRGEVRDELATVTPNMDAGERLDISGTAVNVVARSAERSAAADRGRAS